MNLFKRLTALFLTVVLIAGLLPVGALAAEQEEINLQFTHINPKYEGIFTEADLLPPSGQRIQTYAATDYLPPEEAGLLIRPLMKEREETIAVNVNVPQKENAYLEAVANEMFSIAIAHTGVPTEGDYLRWQYGGWHVGISGRGVAGDYDLTFTYTFTYYTTAAEEQQVDTAVANLLSDLNLSGKSDYEKIKAVYDYICANVRYDHEHVNDESYKHQFTAYAALFDGTAVCQGYSVLLYRLALELGIDCRFISGLGNGGAHGWNIIKLDNLYYNADSTWDEGQTNYSWFLKSEANFPRHVRDEEYDTDAFHSSYPMASADYVPHTHSYSTTVTAPTCTEKGYTTYTCSCGDTYKADYVDATGHSFGDWYQTLAPTEEAAGEERRDCENCDVYETREVEKLEPSDPYSGTCGENLAWVFDEETGTLTISGSGAMYDYEYADSTLPWKAFSSQILTATLEEGVTSLGSNSLYLCEAMTQLNLPASLASVSIDALPSIGALAAINVDPANPDYFSDSGVLYDVNLNALIKYPMSKADKSYSVQDSISIVAFVAFGNCTNLQELFFTGHAPQISEIAFANTTLTAYYPVGDATYTENGMQNYGGTITWKPYCPNQHSWNEGNITQEPTCTQPGYANYACTICGATKTEEIPAAGHSWDAGVVTKEPTCTQPGYANYTCTICDATKTEEIPAAGHSWDTGVVTKEPTETQTGIRTYSCTTCGERKTEEIPVHVHEYVPVVTEPTCTQQGYITYTCSCGDSFVENYADPTDHNWDSGEITKEPTETETGIRTYTCLTCGEHLFETLPTIDHTHDYEITITEPTCTQQGYTTYACGCGYSYVDNYVDATGHSYGDWYQTKAPTEAEAGEERRDCENCDHFETRVIEKLEPSDPYSGTCGDNLTWNFNETSGKLSVSGSGDMYGADKLGWTAFAGDIRSVEIGNGATSVGAYAFSDCTNLADVQMPDTVMSIAYNAFENCSSLKTVDIPESVMEISYGAFMDCTGLASVELPQNVMAISYHAFDNCTSLAAVEFPASLASIQDEAFGSCSGLDELRFTGNAPEIQSNAFYNVTSDAYYPAANTTWTEAVRQNYGGTLTWIAVGGTVTPDNSCGENITWSFEEATGTLTISGTEPMARSNGSSVMDDYDSPEDTPWYSIQDQIITIIIEDTVDSIGKNAFAGCSNLTTVIMEEGVSEVDATAFSGCDSLENCYFAGTEEQWEDLGIDMGEATVHTESAEPETHTETKTTIAPTCTEQGYDLYTCSCGATRKDNFKAPAGHSWDNGVVTREPTANQPGIRTFTCKICKETREESIAKLESVQRVYGASRDDTALEVADQLKATLGVEKFDSMIIAVGDNDRFADALSGSYLATQKGAPILIYCWNRLSAATKEYIQNNLSENGTIYILGDTPAVPLEVEEYLLGENYNVVRLAGEDRYLTNLAILEEAGVGDKEILVATGNSFPDSLSAAATGLPIVLVNGLGSKLKAAQKEFFEKLDGNKITILGSEDAVNTTIEKAIEEIVGTEVNRIAGTEREETSKLIAEKYYTEADFALVAYSWNFPDGLCGGPLAYAMKTPLLVSRKNRETLTNGYITDREIEAGYILGSTDVIADEVARKIFGLADDAIIGTK